MTTTKTIPECTHQSEHCVDIRLRQLLDPDPLTVRRLVTNALVANARRADKPALRLWWPRLAVAAVMLAALLLIPIIQLMPERDRGPESPPPRILISNDSGYLTITTTAGSKTVILTGDQT